MAYAFSRPACCMNLNQVSVAVAIDCGSQSGASRQ
jgi:hypothetical protein